MSTQPHHIAEPTLPEHELIRAADTLPELSSSLRSNTLAVCQGQVVRARRAHYRRVTGVTVLVASLLITVFAVATTSWETDAAPIAEDSTIPAASPGISVSPGHVTPQTGGLAVGDVGPRTELEGIEGTMEDLGNRMLKANIIPGR